jgi:succinyl-CoA synthetase beta subunit
MQLVTPQTSAEGKKSAQSFNRWGCLLSGESETSEFYVSVLLNRATGRNMIMYSTEGGMDIEEVEHTLN